MKICFSGWVLLLFISLISQAAGAQSIRDRFSREDVAGDLKDYLMFSDAELLANKNLLEASQKLTLANVQLEVTREIFLMKKESFEKNAITKEEFEEAELKLQADEHELKMASIRMEEVRSYSDIWQHYSTKELHGLPSDAQFLRQKYLEVWGARCHQRQESVAIARLHTSFYKIRFQRAEALRADELISKDELLERKVALKAAELQEKTAVELAGECESMLAQKKK